MGHTTHEVLAGGPGRSLRRLAFLSTALVTVLLVPSLAYAQQPSSPSPVGDSQAPGPQSGQSGVSNFFDSVIPGFQVTAGFDVSETYASNGLGYSYSLNPGADYISMFAFNLGMHDHSRLVSLDANYSGAVSYYARNTLPVQFTNNLDAFTAVTAIPEYLTFIGRAFAQPVVISNVGVLTANNSTAPGGYNNGYGFSAGPEITFRLGDFASSMTDAIYSAAFFTLPEGSGPFPVIPGLAGPQNTVTRRFSEKLSSGTDFSRLSWNATALFSETDRTQGLLSEKVGVGTLRFAITHEIALLGTGGYDAISNTTRLAGNISGPVIMGGIALNYEDLQFEFQAGQKYNSPSYEGTLRYNLSPSATISGSATDGVQTPESQLLGNLGQLTSTPNGTLASSQNLYSNGSAGSLASFSAQSPGSGSFTQNISRYQRVELSYFQDFQRYHANISGYGMRITQLDGVLLGPPTTTSWGVNASLAHDITRLLTGSIGGGYSEYQELGGDARVVSVNGQLSYSLSPDTNIYFRTDYVDRQSSTSLQAFSPYTGSLNDLRLTLGLSHRL